MTEEKIRENRLRRVAQRQGLRLLKSRIRDERALGYGGYMLVDSNNNVVMGATGYAYSENIDSIEWYLTER